MHKRIAEYVATHKEQFVTDYKNGMSLQDIANEHGLASVTIKNCLENSGMAIRSNAQQRTYKSDQILLANERSIIREYKSGTGQLDLAKRYQVTKGALRRFLTSRGVVLRTTQEQMRFKVDQKLAPHKTAIICSYKKGETIVGLAGQYGVTVEQMYLRLTRWEVKLRGRFGQHGDLYILKAIGKTPIFPTIYKVGISENTELRRKNIAEHVRFYHLVVCKVFKGRASMEKSVQQHLKRYHVGGEYFIPSKAIRMLVSGKIPLEAFLQLDLDLLDNPEIELPLFQVAG